MEVDGTVQKFEPRCVLSGETMLLANMFILEPVIIGRIKENPKNDLKMARILEQIVILTT